MNLVLLLLPSVADVRLVESWLRIRGKRRNTEEQWSPSANNDIKKIPAFTHCVCLCVHNSLGAWIPTFTSCSLMLWDISIMKCPELSALSQRRSHSFMLTKNLLSSFEKQRKQFMEMALVVSACLPSCLCEVLFSLCHGSFKMQSGIYLAIQVLAVFKFDFCWIIGLYGFFIWNHNGMAPENVNKL